MPTMKSRDINQKYSTYLKCQPIICVCVGALYFIHADTLTHTKHHRMIKINYIINLIIEPNENNVCVSVFLFSTSFMREWGAFFFVYVYVFFASFRSPKQTHQKFAIVVFPNHLANIFWAHIYILHSDRRYRIRMAYASGENIFDAVILLFDKFQRKPMVRKWQHAQRSHTHYTDTDTDTHNTINSMCVYGFLFIRSNRNKMWKTVNSGNSHGGRNYKEKKKEQFHIFEQIAFWLSPSASVRFVSRMMPMIRILSAFYFGAVWVYKSWKHFVWWSQCDRIHSARIQANQNEKLREMCIWNRVKHIHTRAKLQTMYA